MVRVKNVEFRHRVQPISYWLSQALQGMGNREENFCKVQTAARVLAKRNKGVDQIIQQLQTGSSHELKMNALACLRFMIDIPRVKEALIQALDDSQISSDVLQRMMYGSFPEATEKLLGILQDSCRKQIYISEIPFVSGFTRAQVADKLIEEGYLIFVKPNVYQLTPEFTYIRDSFILKDPSLAKEENVIFRKLVRLQYDGDLLCALKINFQELKDPRPIIVSLLDMVRQIQSGKLYSPYSVKDILEVLGQYGKCKESSSLDIFMPYLPVEKWIDLVDRESFDLIVSVLEINSFKALAALAKTGDVRVISLFLEKKDLFINKFSEEELSYIFQILVGQSIEGTQEFLENLIAIAVQGMNEFAENGSLLRQKRNQIKAQNFLISDDSLALEQIAAELMINRKIFHGCKHLHEQARIALKNLNQKP